MYVCMPASTTMNNVIIQYMPVVHLHSRETCMPASAEWFIERSELRRMSDDEVLAPKGGVTPSLMAENADGCRLVLPDAGDYGGAPATNLDIDVPVYVRVKKLQPPPWPPHLDDRASAREGCLEIEYMYFFPYNKGRFGIGDHQGDWEHVTVRVTRDPPHALLGVRYNNHRDWEGVWVAAKDVPLTERGQIAAYCALGGHGFWPSAGIQPRIALVGSDLTDARGIAWRPRTILRMVTDSPEVVEGHNPDRMSVPRFIIGNPVESGIEVRPLDADWLKFRGEWGTSESVPVRGWFRGAATNATSSLWSRVFPCCGGGG